MPTSAASGAPPGGPRLSANRPPDVSGRPTRLREVDLDTFFRPQAVAVIGATDAPRRPSTGMWRKLRGLGRGLRRHGHPGQPRAHRARRPDLLPHHRRRARRTRRPGGHPGGRLRAGLRGGGRGQGQVRGDLRRRVRRGRRRRRRAPTPAGRAGGRVRHPPAGAQHQPQRLRDLRRVQPGPAPGPHHPVGPPGPPRVPVPGRRLRHVALGAVRQRGRPRVRRLRRPGSPTSPATGAIAAYVGGLQGRPHGPAGRRRGHASRACPSWPSRWARPTRAAPWRPATPAT